MTQSRQRRFHGVRTRTVLAAPDPDSAPRAVQLPALWDDQAAAALAALADPRLAAGPRPLSLQNAAERWLCRLPAALAAQSAELLLTRRAAPDAALWGGGATGAFVLNLAAFDEPGFGLHTAALRMAATCAVEALAVLAPGIAPRLRLTDLDGMLAAAGLPYESKAGRCLAGSVCAMLAESGAVLVAEANPVEALLGAEASGIAPRFSWLDAAGRLSRGALARLAAENVSAEAALATCLAGGAPLPLPAAADHAAMQAALTPWVDAPAFAVPQAASRRRDMPVRPGGYARRVTLGGHRLFVRTGEYDDGTLAELSLGLPRESASVRGLADALAQIASLALQHGTPLAELVEALAGTRFGPAGAVDGDPAVTAASSPLDYLARSLACAYLPDLVLPPVEQDGPPPPLPLDLPQQSRPRLRVVT